MKHNNVKKIIVLFLMPLVAMSVSAQVKIGLWEPYCNTHKQVKKSVFFNGTSLVKNTATSIIDVHSTAILYLIAQGIAIDYSVYHAGFTPLTAQLTNSGIMCLSIDERKKHLKLEYDYYNRFAKLAVAWFKAQKVRVVNMSFGTSATIFAENNLNLAATDTARFTAAKEWMRYFKNSFEIAFTNAPEILFIVAAGNDEEDMAQSYDVPGLVDLPNILCVGALSKNGQRKISNYGKRIDVYLPAEALEWKDNVGNSHFDTGTSLAVPLVTKKAAQLLAVNPKISAKELKSILVNWYTKTIVTNP